MASNKTLRELPDPNSNATITLVQVWCERNIQMSHPDGTMRYLPKKTPAWVDCREAGMLEDLWFSEIDPEVLVGMATDLEAKTKKYRAEDKEKASATCRRLRFQAKLIQTNSFFPIQTVRNWSDPK